MVSRHEGATLTDQITTKLASDLCGLALVADIDDEVSRYLTSKKGKEWSCFNGGIRLYWPMSFRAQDPYAHPLWIRSSLLSGVTEVRDVSYRIRRQLRRKILGLSAFSVWEPEFFRRIRNEARRQELEIIKSKTTSDDDWKQLAEAYAHDNGELRKYVEKRDDEIRDLQLQVTNLQLALRWQPDDHLDLQPEAEMPPATVSEAVEIAQKKYHDTLVFGDDVARGIESLIEDVGPPEKILTYLKTLSDMAVERRKGVLGTTAIMWLRNHGINASGESETVLNSDSEMKKRTWHDGDKMSRFEQHLKPSDVVSPDKCVRIYFDYDETSEVVRIGWIGQHP